MSVDAIQRVKEAEDQARNKIEEAKRKAVQIVEEGKQEAEAKYKEIVSKAQDERRIALEKSRSEGNESAKPILERAEVDSGRIRNIKDQDLAQIEKLIVERIVN